MRYKNEILRIIDANINRAKEGIRVCEDIMRLLTAHKKATQELRNIRHAITAVIKNSSLRSLAIENYRNSIADVGKNFPSQKKKNLVGDIFFANAQRTKEALRVLEEMLLLFDAKASQRFQKLRFQFYDIEKICSQTIRRIHHH